MNVLAPSTFKNALARSMNVNWIVFVGSNSMNSLAIALLLILSAMFAYVYVVNVPLVDIRG